ncbi:AtpZ/AtpI family protein [Heliophilum fasciatum]|uniref:Putative F0F1-ATPase subunit (Ca2+/Mg2+ transporter) n=1 Tax=Heliophilum fasciatum TaxID=35700 RepID=A0A4R2RRV5_9FIRM|nr:AtpZ/AtpI family protein [Heliophilum fasciatum]MCW2277482.1 F0F1-type ATP synthase assembly protein I [Heliophilum fasciatum]TCP65227.1 putative F0F1-ATPase subunit (Ca2+/Mg2+ transporter) [Heliophilum fasciatum]
MTSSMRDTRRTFKAIALVSSIGTQFAASVVLGFMAGRYADTQLGTDPWLMLCGVLVGVASGFFSVYHLVKKHYREDERKFGTSPTNGPSKNGGT